MVIRHVEEGSEAERIGIRPGEKLLSINGAPIRDLLDYHFHVADRDLVMVLEGTGGVKRTLELVLDDGADLGLAVDSLKTRLCGNDCVFCFVDQNPEGMRRTIYVKDEDYRLSFLHGNFVTLTNMKQWEIDRIVEQRLTPIYVSVHSTNRETRRRLLRPKRDRDILALIDTLIQNGIVLHTQIVLCPGINDGADLDRSIEELAARWPGVMSLAVVPLGMTQHRKDLAPLEPVTPGIGRKLLEQVERHAARFRKEHGVGFVYLADEIYRLLDLEVPPASSYDHFPQIENGIGMTRDFLDRLALVEKLFPETVPSEEGPVTLVTGEMFEPILKRAILSTLERTGETQEARIVGCTNRFFGSTVTVAGLLSGTDIVRGLEGRDLGRKVYIPPATLNDDRLFLDDMTLDQLSRLLGVPIECEWMGS